MENDRQCQQWAGPRSGGRRGSAAWRSVFSLERRDTRQCRELISARLNAAAGRSAVPHPGRDFRARCRIGGPAALEALGRQIGTDIRHSAGVVLARASNWERRRLYRGRISGMDDEERAGDAALNHVSPGRRALAL